MHVIWKNAIKYEKIVIVAYLQLSFIGYVKALQTLQTLHILE